LKLWLLDADVIIDLLAANAFNQLVEIHDVHVAETVANEVKYYKVRGKKIRLDFKAEYVETDKVKCLSVSVNSYSRLIQTLPASIYQGMDDGEQESLAALLENLDLIFCTCDKAAIMSLPFLNCEDRGISTERLLRESGVTASIIHEKNTEKYFRDCLGEGQARKILGY
jgi:hypothetical protein